MSVRIRRGFVQTIFAFLHNSYLLGFWQRSLYRGGLKKVCVPGLNCYSCPGAVGSCPIGAFQSVVTGVKHHFSFYVAGFVLLFGTIAGRFICGWICPFGLYQDLLYKIPTLKKRLYKLLLWGKYFVLLVFVLILPIFLSNDFGIGNPAFCKLICPAGFMEAGIPAVFIFPSLQGLIGTLFYIKLSFFVFFTGLSTVYYRFFCRAICPLGALYSLSNRFSFLQIAFDESLCIDCGKCERACKMEIDIKENQQNLECIRCKECVEVCPTNALRFGTLFCQKITEANRTK